MFGFSRITKYDMDYLNKKKGILEELLSIRGRLEQLCLEYDEDYQFLKTSYNTAQNTDYISLFVKKYRRDRSKSMDDVIREALAFQASELKTLKEKLEAKFVEVINTNLTNTSSPYHLIFRNTLEAERKRFDFAHALYRELNIVSFIRDASGLENYLRVLGIIYSSFLAGEYSKLKQVR